MWEQATEAIAPFRFTGWVALNNQPGGVWLCRHLRQLNHLLERRKVHITLRLKSCGGVAAEHERHHALGWPLIDAELNQMALQHFKMKSACRFMFWQAVLPVDWLTIECLDQSQEACG